MVAMVPEPRALPCPGGRTGRVVVVAPSVPVKASEQSSSDLQESSGIWIWVIQEGGVS